jgi:hypothetical protein
MSKIKNTPMFYLVPVIIFLLAFVGRSFFYYRGSYTAPDVPESEAQKVAVLSEPEESIPVIADGNRVILIDDSHINKFSDEEMTTLFGRITAAGGRIEKIHHKEDLEARLSSAYAFVSLGNQGFYDLDELIILENFVQDGGRILIVGDPTRITLVNAINSLSGHFGIIYEDDYIYNLVENDGNYLNVIVRDFAENPLTNGVNEIVFRAAHSMRAGDGGLAFGDPNTYSSLREQPGDVTVAVLTANDSVLALPDLTFLTGPYNTFADNDKFIDNIVAFLLSGQREYDLLDFPYFFNDTVQLVYPDSTFLSNTFGVSSDLRAALKDAGLEPNQEDDVFPGLEALIISTYDGLDSSMRNTLSEDGIRINSVDNTISLRNVGDLDRADTLLFQLHIEDEGIHQLYILADNAKALEHGVTLLLEGGLEECLIRPETAFCNSTSLATSTPTSEFPPTLAPFSSDTPTPAAEVTPTPSG